jgi:translation initiation factor IF-1
MIEVEKNQSIAKVLKKLGDNRFLVNVDGMEIVAKMRGALRRTRIEIGDYVCVEYVLNLVQIVHKYDDSDAREIRKQLKEEEKEHESQDGDDYFASEKEINIDDI